MTGTCIKYRINMLLSKNYNNAKTVYPADFIGKCAFTGGKRPDFPTDSRRSQYGEKEEKG